MRSSGILMHISSLPSEYGIGDFGIEAYRFIDFLAKSNQTKWQILPLGITSYGDSPYQCFSAFAGNPYFIDLNELIDRGYLEKNQVLNSNLNISGDTINYGHLYVNKMQLLREAYGKAKSLISMELDSFYREHNSWLREFALFMSIKTKNDNKSWIEWDEEYKDSKSDHVIKFETNNKEEIYFWVFTQYFFLNQWLKLKEYASYNDIQIIGDLPIYVSQDSCDVWANPQFFNLDENLLPITVAGCPPDYFSITGQLWGNPIYNWEVLEADRFNWWIKRIKYSMELFDILRIDHFRGFDSYWEIDYGSENAIKGTWTKGPGIKIFDRIKKELGDLNIIAEDLGFLTDDVRKLIKDVGYPGMKVLQFAFDSREESDYLPHNYDKNCVVYTGTHDNSTAAGWFKVIPLEDFDFAVKYLKLDMEEGLNWGLIRGAWSSTAFLAIAQMQDFLGVDDVARMNIPSTLGGNWNWRIDKSSLTDELALKIADLNITYGR